MIFGEEKPPNHEKLFLIYHLQKKTNIRITKYEEIRI